MAYLKRHLKVIEVELEMGTIKSAVKAVVKTACHTILYDVPLQQHSGGPRHSILFTIVFSANFNGMYVVVVLTRLLLGCEIPPSDSKIAEYNLWDNASG